MHVPTARTSANLKPPEWAGHLAGARFALRCWLCSASADVVMRRVYGVLLVAMLVVCWAMQLLSVTVQRGNAEMYRRSGLVISREQGLRSDAGFAVPLLMS